MIDIFKEKIHSRQAYYTDFLKHVAETCLNNLEVLACVIIPQWEQLSNEIKLKTYLQLFCLEQAMRAAQFKFTQKEIDILRTACFYQSIGCINTDSKTCKVYIYSFLGAREILV